MTPHAKPNLRIIPTVDEPLPYDRHETAAEIAHRIRNGIKRKPMVEMLPCPKDSKHG